MGSEKNTKKHFSHLGVEHLNWAVWRCRVKDLNIDQGEISRGIQVGDDKIWLFEKEGDFNEHEARHLPMGPWWLGNSADVHVTQFLKNVGEFISDPVRDSALESEAFGTLI